MLLVEGNQKASVGVGRIVLSRRTFVALLGSAASCPLAAQAQQTGKVHRLAILAQSEPVDRLTGARHRVWAVFFQELQRLGYEEGKNLAVEWRSSAGDARHRSELAVQVGAMRPDAIFTSDVEMARALLAPKSTIPVVSIAAQPVELGMAASLARPGRNITGFSIDAGAGITPKRIALLKEAVPKVSRLAWLVPARIWESETFRSAGQEAARIAGITPVPAILHPPVNEPAYRRAFEGLIREGADSLLAGPNLENITYRRLIAELALGSKLPSVFSFRENVEAGGLMAYAIDLVDIFRRAAGYIDLVLKGSNPAEMPFQQAAKFELIVNLKTAKTLGLSISDAFLARADDLIE